MTAAKRAEAEALKAKAKAIAKAARVAETVAEARTEAKAKAEEAAAKAYQKATKEAERSAAKERARALAAMERADRKAMKAQETLRDAAESPKKLSKNGGYFSKEDQELEEAAHQKQLEDFAKDKTWVFDGQLWTKINPDGSRDLDGMKKWLIKHAEDCREIRKRKNDGNQRMKTVY